MDNIDQQLIAQLRHNARSSVATLASRLGVSRGTVTNRIRKLEDSGVIVGYTVRLRPERDTGGGLQAWTSISIEGNDARRVTTSLLGEPSVLALHSTNGRWDLLAELQVDSLAELAHALERIRLIKGISNTETSIHLETVRAPLNAASNAGTGHARGKG
ncbi:MAG: Lrp/AsnC family transcriptional regulator [Comamonadaceae bacterium]|nr:MAG: Lrp/AsnC family transcriptional regulator [Comamonadaceae bacterium]